MHSDVRFVIIFFYAGFITVFIWTHVNTILDMVAKVNFINELLATVTINRVHVMLPPLV